MRPIGTSLAPPIIFGILLVIVTIVLSAMWNIALVTDWFRAQPSLSGAGYWIVLLSGYVLFLAVIVGLILFIVSLAKQIRLNQRQQNFIDSVTHELKSPLTSLKLHLETMKMRQLPPEKQAEFTQLMLADVERLNLLIDHVLEAARVEQQRREYALAPIALQPVVASVVADVCRRHQLPEGCITMVGEPIEAEADPVALEMVLMNLVENAVKYSRDEVKVTVRTFDGGEGKAAIAISDTGVGIPRSQIKRIFRRFHRVGNELTRTRKGTGLGLYIVKENLKNMHGTIRAESPGENQGSIFTLTLPGARHG